MTSTALEKQTTLFTGRVQGVGFRLTVRDLAAGFRVQGFVRNLDNGQVLLEVEGSHKEIDAFVRAVGERFQGNIEQQESRRSSATGGFSSFEIRY